MAEILERNQQAAIPGSAPALPAAVGPPGVAVSPSYQDFPDPPPMSKEELERAVSHPDRFREMVHQNVQREEMRRQMRGGQSFVDGEGRLTAHGAHDMVIPT